MASSNWFEVPRGPHGPALARRLVRDLLSGDAVRLVQADAELIVSELVTNAVVHGVGTIRLRLAIDDDAVRGEVTDEGPGFEVEVRERGIDAVRGRGLWLVATMARRWGVHAGSSHVWFELALPRAAPTAPAAEAPRAVRQRPVPVVAEVRGARLTRRGPGGSTSARRRTSRAMASRSCPA